MRTNVPALLAPQRAYFFPLCEKNYDYNPGRRANCDPVALISGMQKEIRPHWSLAELAGAQHGVVSHSQLLALGYSPAAIGRSLVGGRLHRLHRGVYAV